MIFLIFERWHLFPQQFRVFHQKNGIIFSVCIFPSNSANKLTYNGAQVEYITVYKHLRECKRKNGFYVCGFPVFGIWPVSEVEMLQMLPKIVFFGYFKIIKTCVNLICTCCENCKKEKVVLTLNLCSE